MIARIDTDAARASHWDVIVAGSSFASQFFQIGLPSNLRVLIIEKGDEVPWDAQIYQDARPVERIRVENRSDREKSFVAHTMFGGNSNCWWGQTPRFHPNDFRLASLYGIGADWPLSYDELEPFYVAVEQVMQVAGGGTEHIHPRSAPLPYPPHHLSRTDEILVQWRPDIWVPVASARANGGDRTSCCTNGICHVCPIDSKFRISNSIAAFARPNVHILMNAECRGIETSARKAGGMTVRVDGREVSLRGDLFALGTNALFNAAILLRSGLGGAAVGRYLHEQESLVLTLDIDAKNYFGGSAITGHCFGAYDGPHRSTAAAVLIENYNAPNALRTDRGRWTEAMYLKLIAEDIPQPSNRVVLDADGTPFVEWTGFTNYAKAGLERAEELLPELLPFQIERITGRSAPSSDAHIQGTHRMGTDPASSVVDAGSRLHGVENLFVLGSGVFPSCSPANPTLTLSALALRAGKGVA
ncbi:MAG: GMC family oxidoreductase [Pseudomonadota bacterium]